MGKPAASFSEDLLTLGRSVRGRFEKGVDRVKQYMDSNHQLRRILKGEYDQLRTEGKTEAEAVASVMGMTQAALDEAVKTEKDAQKTGTGDSTG